MECIIFKLQDSKKIQTSSKRNILNICCNDKNMIKDIFSIIPYQTCCACGVNACKLSCILIIY